MQTFDEFGQTSAPSWASTGAASPDPIIPPYTKPTRKLAIRAAGQLANLAKLSFLLPRALLFQGSSTRRSSL